MWTYEVERATNSVTVFLDGKQYTSICHAKADSLIVNSLKSVRFLYDLGNLVILDDNTSMDQSIQLSKMIQSAVAELISP